MFHISGRGWLKNIRANLWTNRKHVGLGSQTYQTALWPHLPSAALALAFHQRHGGVCATSPFVPPFVCGSIVLAAPALLIVVAPETLSATVGMDSCVKNNGGPSRSGESAYSSAGLAAGVANIWIPSHRPWIFDCTWKPLFCLVQQDPVLWRTNALIPELPFLQGQRARTKTVTLLVCFG